VWRRMAKRNSGNQGGFGLEPEEKKEPPNLSNFRKKNRENEERIAGSTGVARGRRKVRALDGAWLRQQNNNTTKPELRKKYNNGRNSDRFEMTVHKCRRVKRNWTVCRNVQRRDYQLWEQISTSVKVGHSGTSVSL
jgi:hypothetical protein